ncbi:peptidylprolyl isomerase [Stakelama saccharophila]|uniref:peptidylprolyl isomerase n=1 Tax=Stakelama saccharophila TaxID=3075605 RepID=A0ABZ0B9A7_9SPHN|nr:peptidylprolyl isomerase [Stakelama sp. W311]WNO53868.1 peptidylprolyl isomerase [Stakelama sp. W311]
MTLKDGERILIRLAPDRAPVHVANIRALAHAHWWDGTSIYRVQDNYVAQWGDVTEDKPLPRPVVANPPPEYAGGAAAPAVRLSRPDPYSDWAGVSADGWPVAGNDRRSWLPHCYAMVGVARNLAPSTGSGAELYTVIGHAPRHLDRNIAVIGRIIEGVEHLSALPRGKGDLGFYADASRRVPIARIRLASDLPRSERPHYQYRAADNPRFRAYVHERENRQPPFFTVPAGGADICNVPLAVRKRP